MDLGHQTLSARAEEKPATATELTYEVNPRDGCFLTAARVAVNDENIMAVQCRVCVGMCVCVCVCVCVGGLDSK